MNSDLLKSHKMLIGFMAFSLIILGLTVYKSNLQVSFTGNTGLYFYSALLQANAAIFSIVGVFYIFRLQSINSAISEFFFLLTSQGSAIREEAIKFRNASTTDKEAKVKKLSMFKDGITFEYSRWLILEKELLQLRKKYIPPITNLTFLIVFEIFFLLLSETIHNIGGCTEYLSYSIVSVFQIYILITMMFSIKETIIINKRNIES